MPGVVNVSVATINATPDTAPNARQTTPASTVTTLTTVMLSAEGRELIASRRPERRGRRPGTDRCSRPDRPRNVVGRRGVRCRGGPVMGGGDRSRRRDVGGAAGR
ncbi:MAG: hypothetical protein EOP32_26220 [Rhodococcus sp. (in: high G+C Gram-positive bacteria)]|nr:MAG: hypothetical protein EOP32_26220 [Rhodococcus sp. (in: high G+C Gram-positive bacteria)]